uniref:Dna-directed rna polymerase i subunit rpa1 isoform x1 n=1 Tax=Triatoma infestans TaxID=30076 RepID=A0A171AFQ9_TRIIF
MEFFTVPHCYHFITLLYYYTVSD